VVASFSFSVETVSYSDEARRIAVNIARLPGSREDRSRLIHRAGLAHAWCVPIAA
jgi:hypothetical protein